MNVRVRTATVIAVFAAIVGISMPVAVQAAEDGPPVQLSITAVDSPESYFDFTVNPGESRDLEVKLVNNAADPIMARTNAVNVLTLVNGGLGAAETTESQKPVTLWSTYPEKTLNLRPGVPVAQKFTVTVPEGTEPGRYLSMITLRNEEPITDPNASGGISLGQILRQVIAVAVTVPGTQRPELTIGEAEYKTFGSNNSVISVNLDNPGTATLQPSVEFILRDADKVEVTRATTQMLSFYALTPAIAEMPAMEPLPAGAYTVDVTVTDAVNSIMVQAFDLPIVIVEDFVPPTVIEDPDNPTTVQPDLTMVFILIGILGGLLFLALLIIIGLLLRRRKKDDDETDVPAGDIQHDSERAF